MMPDLAESIFQHTVPYNHPVEDNHPDDSDGEVQYTTKTGKTDQFDDRLRNEQQHQ